MMVPVADVLVQLDGNKASVLWRVLSGGERFGISEAHGVYGRVLGEDLGEPEGAETLAFMIAKAGYRISAEFRGAWGDVPLF